MTQTKAPAAHSDIVAAARASRKSAAAFRAQVERLKDVSFEGTMAAVLEFRLMARAMNQGRSQSEALQEARAIVANRSSGSVALPLAAE